MTDTARSTEVLVVGGGPAGAATAYWLARQGHDVTIVERRTFPRGKTCGDALTPRAVHELERMGLGPQLAGAHRYFGVRVTGMGRELELQWPSHPILPQHGYVMHRRELDELAARNAVAAGATLLERHEAVQPLIDRGFVRGATVQDADGDTIDVAARYVVVADGANSRFGRAVGTFRTREWPYATAIRTYWESPRHGEPWVESAIDLKDRNGNNIPGFGWVVPAGDGTVNIGVGLLSTFRDFKSANTAHLLDEYAIRIADRWQIDPERPLAKTASGRIPMGGSVGPKAGPTYLVVGDAAGSVNPFNGDGIGYAYETGRMAAQVLHDALSANDPTALQQYPRLLDDTFGEYFKVARLFARAIGRPAVMRELTRLSISNRSVMESSFRIMANMLRPDRLGPAEVAIKTAAALVRLAPNA